MFRILPSLATKLFTATHASADAKIFLVSFAVLFLAWLSYVVRFAPGSDCYETGKQIAQFMSGSYSTYHPLCTTFIYGAVFSFGDAIGGVNAGILFAALFQTLVLAAALAFEVLELSRMGFKKWTCVVALAFFAIVPVFGSYCQWVVKDTLFSAGFTLYVTVYIRCCLHARKGGAIPTRDLVFLLAASVLVGLLRSNGLYIVGLATLTLTLVYRKKLSAGKVALLLAAIPLAMSLNQAALVAICAQQGDIREVLSIPFQQTARCALEHPDDATQAEQEAIDAVLNYSNLAERYEWNTSVPVKEKAATSDKVALLEYFKVWVAQGLRHPLCYAEAFFDQTFGYWSCENPLIYEQDFAKFKNYWIGHELGDSSLQFFPELASIAKQSVDKLRNLPLLGLFSIAGFYTLAGLVLAALAFYRGRPGALVVLVPSAVLLLTCLADPLNGSIRYMFGAIAVFPIIAGAILHILFAPSAAS